MSTDVMFTDRSRMLTYQRCPYRRYIDYHWDGVGVSPYTVAVPLATGGSIHLGLQRLLEGASVDEAVQDALAYYRTALNRGGFADTRDAHQEYLVGEQLALTEVMVRAWALKRLPLFQKLYNVIEVEREAPATELAPGIFLLRRPDGVLENIATGFYEVLSFKTAKYYSFKNDESNIVDVQGISETWAVAERYGEEKVGPVLMEFLVTGPRKLAVLAADEVHDAIADLTPDDVAMEPKGAPLKYQWNPLIRAWRDNYGNVSWRYKMPDPQDVNGRMPTMAKFFNPYYGRKPSKAEPLIPRYIMNSFAVWEEMPVKEWFEKMARHEVFPQWCDPFDKMFVSRKYDRMPYELKEWQREVAIQEMRVKRALSILADPKYNADAKEAVMAEVFPKYRHSCQYPTPCPNQRICWRGVTDPLTAGYHPRVSNHPERLAALSPEEGQ